MAILDDEGTIRLWGCRVQISHTLLSKKSIKNLAIGYGDGLIIVFNKKTTTLYKSWQFNGEQACAEGLFSFFNLKSLGKVHKVPVLYLETEEDYEDYID